MVLDALIALLLLAGALFTLIGSIGLVRLPDVFMRLHGPTKATTLGVGSVLLGALAYFTRETGVPQVDNILIALFLFLTAPVSAHLMARAALHRGCDSRCPSPHDTAAGEALVQPTPEDPHRS